MKTISAILANMETRILQGEILMDRSNTSHMFASEALYHHVFVKAMRLTARIQYTYKHTVHIHRLNHLYGAYYNCNIISIVSGHPQCDYFLFG